MGKNANIDSSSLSVYGDYTKYNEEKDVVNQEETKVEVKKPLETPKITHGFSKDHRPDLKQIVINLATTGASGFQFGWNLILGMHRIKKSYTRQPRECKNFAPL